MYTGIYFDGKHSYRDFGMTISNFNIGYPSKIKRIERVPYSNEFYDFSSVYGGQEFEERPITYTLNIVDRYLRKSLKDNYIAFDSYQTSVLNWLMSGSGKKVLKDDKIPGYYFLAELIENPNHEFKFVGGTLTVNFTAYPFKISELEEGHDIWDDFNFLLDYAQITQFEVNGSKEITLYNPGISPAKPVIEATASMEIRKGTKIFTIPAGESQSYDFMLPNLENKMTIIGNGSITFHFRKELI